MEKPTTEKVSKNIQSAKICTETQIKFWKKKKKRKFQKKKITKMRTLVTLEHTHPVMTRVDYM